MVKTGTNGSELTHMSKRCAYTLSVSPGYRNHMAFSFALICKGIEMSPASVKMLKIYQIAPVASEYIGSIYCFFNGGKSLAK